MEAENGLTFGAVRFFIPVIRPPQDSQATIGGPLGYVEATKTEAAERCPVWVE